jgi:type II secretory ATPase GspE/PulE/Tfp pilus assembly ATPase PilB-like protein
MSEVQHDLLASHLISLGVVSKDQLALAAREQKRTGDSLANVLRSLRFIDEHGYAKALGSMLRLEVIELKKIPIDPNLFARVDPAYALDKLFVPVAVEEDSLVVAMANPSDVEVSDFLEKRFGRALNVKIATESEVRHVIERQTGAVSGLGARIESSIDQVLAENDDNSDRMARADTPLIELVDDIISQGIRDSATDVHIEPEEKIVRVRYRIDGILLQGPSLPKALQSAVLARIKIMAELDIAERRLPQDGRIHISKNGSHYDIRVSILPTSWGENVVMRVLDTSMVVHSLDALGMPDDIFSGVARIMSNPYGIFLVTGPTGSGKSTTLYGSLGLINSMEKKVVTVEDPIEYRLPLIRQSQVNASIGYTFADGLRSILRQDPDVIMVGEIRDLETIQIAVRAGLTGHLVLSTLHTNSAIGALPRMVDMGLEPFLVTSSLLGVLAQRLVRRICTACKISAPASPAEKKLLGAKMDEEFPLFRGRGCPECRGSGYKGRVGVYELYVPDEEDRALILKNANEDELRQRAKAKGVRFMIDVGMEKVLMGVTTIEEILRVIRHSDL